jgi:hypothetical protein
VEILVWGRRTAARGNLLRALVLSAALAVVPIVVFSSTLAQILDGQAVDVDLIIVSALMVLLCCVAAPIFLCWYAFHDDRTDLWRNPVRVVATSHRRSGRRAEAGVAYHPPVFAVPEPGEPDRALRLTILSFAFAILPWVILLVGRAATNAGLTLPLAIRRIVGAGCVVAGCAAVVLGITALLRGARFRAIGCIAIVAVALGSLLVFGFVCLFLE